MLDIAQVVASEAMQRPMKMSEMAAVSAQIAGFFYDYYPAIRRFLPPVEKPKLKPESIVKSSEFLSEYTIVSQGKPDVVRVSGVFRQLISSSPYYAEHTSDKRHSLGVFPSVMVASIPASTPVILYYGKRRERMQCCVPIRWQSLLRYKLHEGVSIKAFGGYLLHALQYPPQVVRDADVICSITPRGGDTSPEAQLYIAVMMPALLGYRLSHDQIRTAVACARALLTFHPKLY